MGQHLIPDALSIQEAANFLGEPPLTRSWGLVEGGVLVKDSESTDAELAALYTEFTPSGVDDMLYVEPLPAAVRGHLPHLRDYLQASPGQITNAQTVHVVQDLIRAVHYLNNRLADEG